jgi:hypothetical protein
MVPIREPSLLGHPGRQLRLPLLESGLKPRRLPPPLLLPPGQGLPQKPRQLRPPLLLPLKPPQLPQDLLPPMVLSPETVRYPHAREPRPQDLHHLRGPAPIDGGPLKTHNPDPYPPTRYPVSSACTATDRSQATRNSSATFRETPQPMLQVCRRRPRLPPPLSPTTPAGDGATAPASGNATGRRPLPGESGLPLQRPSDLTGYIAWLCCAGGRTAPCVSRSRPAPEPTGNDRAG